MLPPKGIPSLDLDKTKYTDRGVEKVASHVAHNHKVAGSSPAPAIWLVPYFQRLQTLADWFSVTLEK
jgi:hypothetical protein